MLTHPGLRCTPCGGRAVYFPCEHTDVIQVSTIVNFPPDLLVTGDKVSKYTARPPQGLSHFRAGFVHFYGMNEGIVQAPWENGGRAVYKKW